MWISSKYRSKMWGVVGTTLARLSCQHWVQYCQAWKSWDCHKPQGLKLALPRPQVGTSCEPAQIPRDWREHLETHLMPIPRLSREHFHLPAPGSTTGLELAPPWFPQDLQLPLKCHRAVSRASPWKKALTTSHLTWGEFTRRAALMSNS